MRYLSAAWRRLKRRWVSAVVGGAVGGFVGVFLHDRYPGLYVLAIVLGVLATIWLWVRVPDATVEDILERHRQRELARSQEDSVLVRELKAMFAARACDWDALASEDVYWRTHSQTPCPVCGHGLLFHEPLTKVCDVCHAPGG